MFETSDALIIVLPLAPHKPGMIIQQVAAGDGVLDTNGTIETGQSTSNVAWGEDEQTLFITGG